MDQQELVEGHLPFYSVDTREEAERITHLAIARGEFLVQRDGSLVEARLRAEQSLEKLAEAGRYMAEIHRQIKEG